MPAPEWTIEATIPAGEPFMVGLPARPVTGYHWEPAAPRAAAPLLAAHAFLSAADPGTYGGAGVETWLLAPAPPGDYTLAFVYHRPWETETPPIATATVTLHVRATPASELGDGG